jgi:hypothetical protein
VEIGTTSCHGSGVKISEGIITNAHVVLGGCTLQVATYDHRIVSATVLRIDRTADLALLSANLNIPPLDMEYVAQQRQGDEVLVLGYPLDLNVNVGGRATLTRGLISDTWTEQGTGRVLIQTDAAVNHGNSGGALVNMRGKLIGLPTFGRTDAQNINFAVAVDTISTFLGPANGVLPSPPKPNPTPPPTPVPPTPTAPSQVPATAVRGGADWQVAGYVNIGEPTIRVAYDPMFPDGRAIVRASRIISILQSRVPQLRQPGRIDGLPEVAYSARIGGVQLQLYSDTGTMAAAHDVFATHLFRDAGLPIARCAPSIASCPGYDPGPWGGTAQLPPDERVGPPYPGDV